MVYWDRPTLKARAKQVLRMPGIYWMSVLFMLVYTLFSGGTAVASAGGSSSTATTGAYGSMQEDHIAEAFGEHQETMLRVLPVMAFVAIVLIAIGIAYTIFASNIITVGKNRYFIDCRSGKANFGSLFWGFRQGRYMATVKAMFGYTVRLFLWTLLLIVPGIIKAYEYWMVPYILAENPNIDVKRALSISKQATQGEKFNIFVLEISFIGWMMLGALACGIGTMFVTPYVEATQAELFGALRLKAEREGICQVGEIGSENSVCTAQQTTILPQG